MYGPCRCIMFVNFLIGSSLLSVEKLKCYHLNQLSSKCYHRIHLILNQVIKSVLSSNPIGTSPRNKILLLNSFQANVLFPCGLKHSKNRVFFMFFRLTKPWNYSHINFPFTYRNIHKTRNASLENISIEKIKLKNLLQVYFEKLLFLMKLFVLSEINLKTVEGTWSSYYYGYKTRNTFASISFISNSYFFIIYNTTILQN